MHKVDILGCEFNAWSTKETLEQVEKLIKSEQRDYLCTVNTAILTMMRKDSQLENFINNSNFVVADGQPIIWASKYKKDPLPERVTGVELVPDLANLAAKNSWGVFLMGATQDIVTDVAEKLQVQYPNLKISGVEDGFFSGEQSLERAKLIRESEAKILIVAMGVPRQEYFIDQHWKELGVNFAVGVGGSFDVISGKVKRAPLWMQNSGLEWLYRLLQEPRRLFKRYLNTNTQFIYLFFKEIVFGISSQKNQ
jgi:N-acetylglucosaminyldiphosphoundecaprenol N-acetyl-beta-D-mannosaminyltransferase